jgi:hypothetical protein
VFDDKFSHGHKDLGTVDAKYFCLVPVSSGTIEAIACKRIDHPYIWNSHAAIVFDSLLVAMNPVFRREYLDDDQRRLIEDTHRGITLHNTDIGYPKTGGTYLYTHFRQRIKAPLLHVFARPEYDCHLEQCMLTFTHIPLLKFALNKVAIRLVAGSEIFFRS